MEQFAAELIKKGADANMTDEERKALLQKAVDMEREEFAVELIKKGTACNMTNKECRTLLEKAVKYERKQVITGMICRGADVNFKDESGKTLLMAAVALGREQIALELINSGADVNLTDSKGNSALMYATNNKYCISILIKEGKSSVVNQKNNIGRTPLFDAVLHSNDSALCLLENGGQLHVTDDFNVSILSFYMYHCINNTYASRMLHEKLDFLKRTGIEDQAIVQTVLNCVFCKLPQILNVSWGSQNILTLLQVAANFQGNNQKKRTTIQGIIAEIEENKLTLSNLPDMLSLLFEIGADPNTADENGNTASHYLALSLLHVSDSSVMSEICNKLQKLGLAFYKRNCNQETPLMFFLSSVVKQARIKAKLSGIRQVVEISRFLFKSPTSLNDTEKNGKSVFHLLIELFQEGLNLQDKNYQTTFLCEAVNLLKLFSSSVVVKSVTVNKIDNQLNTPLHYWASLSLPSAQGYQSEDCKAKFLEVLETIFKYLLSCGALLNSRNRNEETPLHWCKTWRAVKLLVDQGANTNDVDLTGRQPLLAAAQNREILENVDCFYPDVTDDPLTFWRVAAVDKGFDLWVCDRNGDSILSSLIKSESYALSKALVEVSCEDGCNKSQRDLVCLLKAVCKDESAQITWKAILADIILKAIRNPANLEECLQLSCKNVQEFLGDNGHVEAEAASKEVEIQSLVHWELAKKLLWVGADGNYCLDLVDDCPALKSLLTKPPSVNEIPMVIPWTSHSKTFQSKLAEVARRRNCESVEGTTYWKYSEHIAEGAFGHVFAGINGKDGMEVAIKRVERLRMVRPEDKREIRTFTKLTDCKQIVQYLAFHESKDFSYVILELMEGNLDDYFSSAVYNSTESTNLSKDVAMGLTYLHDQNIIHRDLKPSNILYKTHPNLCLKIADFGLSRPLDLGLSVTVMGNNVGTRGWIAPEVVKSSTTEHSKSSDVFSCGLILHYLFSKQQHPFNPADCTGKSEEAILIERESNILNNRMDGWNNSLSSDVSDLVRRMLDCDKKERLSASDLLNHPMFWSNVKKVDFLCAVGDQQEFECPRVKRPSPLTLVENQLEANFSTTVTLGTWDDTRYNHMPYIITESTKPSVKYGKKGKTYTTPVRTSYDKGSVVELVRFIRNAIAHASDPSRPSFFKKLVLEDAVFLDYFPNLLMEVYKAVKAHKWDGRGKIKRVIENEPSR